MVPFFKQWGGLSQTQIQLLQSWFIFWAFILEIPTGVVGDVRGTKFSTILGVIIQMLGFFLYITYPNFYIFLLAEFLIGVGLAFISGSREAWLYDTARKHGLEKRYTHINTLDYNIFLFGMLIASLSMSSVAIFLSLRALFVTHAVGLGIGALILLLIPAVSHLKDSKKDEIRNPRGFAQYLSIVKESALIIKHNKALIKDIVYVIVMATASYFVIWLYQPILSDLHVDLKDFGLYKAFYMTAQITMGLIITKLLLKKIQNKRKLSILLALFVALGYFVITFGQSIPALLFFLLLAGGIGAQIRVVYSAVLNKQIPSDKRATVLSLISMLRRAVLVLINPVVGLIVDSGGVNIAAIGIFDQIATLKLSGLYLALFLLGCLALLGAIIEIRRKTHLGAEL